MTDLFSLRGRRLVFVGGKGGVGKTTLAAALGLRMAGVGERVLLVSTDPAHSIGDLFDRRLGDRERELAATPGGGALFGLEIDPEAEVTRYLGDVKQTMRSFVRPDMYSEIERQMELTRASPGAEEAALMDRVADLMAEGGKGFDRVVFDTAPTGHTLRLLALPEIMASWTEGLLRSRKRSDSLGKALRRLARPARDAGEHPEGDELSWIDQAEGGAEGDAGDEAGSRIREVLLRRRRRFSRARRLMLDPEVTAFVLVLVPEKLPILESRKALEVLGRHGVPVAGLIVNRVLPDEPLGGFLESRRAQEAEYLVRIEEDLAGVPHVHVPLLARDVVGMEALGELGEGLGIEV